MLTIVNTFSNQQTLNITSVCEALLCLCEPVCIIRKVTEPMDRKQGVAKSVTAQGLTPWLPQ